MLRDTLQDIRVIDFSHVVAGPVCGMMLADMGADVVKVESPDGELGRAIGPPWLNGESVAFLSVNRNKRGLAVDLRQQGARDAVMKMAARAHVIVESFRPGVMERLGLDYAAVAKLNPGVVYCSISAYGQSGAQRHMPGVDGVIQAVTGLMSTLGTAGSPPSKVPVPIADMATGYLATIGILAALRKAERTGQGQHIDISLYNATLMLQQLGLAFFFASGDEPQKTGSAAPYASPNEAFPTLDGWIMVAAYQPERWRRLCELLRRPDLFEDPRFASNAQRVDNRAVLNELLSESFRMQSTPSWMEQLEAVDILCAPIASYSEVTRSLQYCQSGVETSIVHPVAGLVRMPGFALGDAQTISAPHMPPPMLGEHSTRILSDYGLTADEIAALVSRGAVSQAAAMGCDDLRTPFPSPQPSASGPAIRND
ncbi:MULTISPECIES: CoA transferase [unclassified Variovorax]|uniref:CaiB/BaiF CoA transferase family protein n=1 Tax=unclassified Variovorax TaxID=663243 RepID=UPI000837CDDB|nr:MULTISPECIES: CoA transferase [unclassified Variovorax]PNG47019.1 Acetyl-CoA:oxalate CoA-transferase [Variovorax sp. B2]PNG48330.1 Acetyl-CoA:oxalate CoA-transferase [Variovorax sp. B4]VTV14872.1 Formyl-coenzyme A transferase [Variovorax sp. WDL1]